MKELAKQPLSGMLFEFNEHVRSSLMSSISDIPAPEECVMAPLLEKWASKKPNQIAFIFGDGSSWTWSEVLIVTRRTASRLVAMGVTSGDHVLSWQPNGPEALQTWFALNYIGAVFVPINTAYKGTILQNLIHLSDAKLMICHGNLVSRLNDIDLGLMLSDVVVIDGDPDLKNVRTHCASSIFGSTDMVENKTEFVGQIQSWDPMYIIFTSGTTGPSKAVISSYVQTYATGAEAHSYINQSDRLLVNLPLFHVSGTVLVAITVTVGASCVIVDGFSTDKFWPVINQYKITTACLLGAMTAFLLKQPPSLDDKAHPLRHVITVPWNEDAAALAKRHELKIRTAFNMTEVCTPIVSDFNPKVIGTCGKPRAGVEVRVVDEFDQTLPPGQIGELIIRTDRPWSMNSGYYKNPEATVRAWRNGWFHTGDAFRYDEDNNFFFVDRVKDSIRRRGENISSFEVESEVSTYPSVLDVAAIPVPSEFSEDEVMIIVSAADDCQIDPDKLFHYLEKRMPYFMLPSYIRVMANLPKTPTQKIRKHLLREQGITDDTWFRGDSSISIRREKLV